jgi:hypothetical protein
VVAAPALHPQAKRRRVRFAERANRMFLVREQGTDICIAIERLVKAKNTTL